MFNGSYRKPSAHVRTTGQEPPSSSSRVENTTSNLPPSALEFQVRSYLMTQTRLFTLCNHSTSEHRPGMNFRARIFNTNNFHRHPTLQAPELYVF